MLEAEKMENDIDIAQLIHRGGIFVDVDAATPSEVYEFISKKIELPESLSASQLEEALNAREMVLSTAVGNGIALPHARTPIMKTEDEQKIVVVYLKNPIDMKAPDERLVSTMFILLTSNSQVHLKILSCLANLFRSIRFRKALEDRAGEAELTNLINELA